MSAITVLKARLTTAEGERIMPYDDATGMAVRAPKGHITWGFGFDLEQCGSTGLFNVMEDYLLTQLDTRLRVYPWYIGLDEVRASVCLEIGYNDGQSGLLHFINFIAALTRQDWATAQKECRVVNPALAARYERLGRIVLTGNPNS